MSIAEKKEEIIKKLQQTNDEKLIDEVYGLLHDDEIVEELQLDTLPVELQQKLNRALEDYKSGNYITHEQMKERIKLWRMK
jgi:uncharacterized protein YjgD (DUF1641 family)